VKTIEYRTIDKSDWGPGPWQGEVDKKQWTDPATGLPCMIRRVSHHGAFCGYVGVPRGHPAYEVDEDDLDLHAHGGVTFSGKCSPGPEDRDICHKVEPGEDDDTWWLGFDCGHAYDLMPAMNALYRRRGEPTALEQFLHDLYALKLPINPLTERGDVYRTQVYVEAECADLAQQLMAMVPISVETSRVSSTEGA
jgi:hypothetical protein